MADVRGLGLMVGLEFVKDKKIKEPYPPEIKLVDSVTREAMERGEIVYPGTGTADGISGDQILLTPPYLITTEQTYELARILDESLKAVEKRNPPYKKCQLGSSVGFWTMVRVHEVTSGNTS